jgi:transposase
MILTYKYRLKDRRAKRALAAHAIACNQVWNFCVATQQETRRRWQAGSCNAKWLSQYNLIALAKGSSKELGIRAQTIQCICERFVRARNKKRGAPKFRASFGSKASLGFIPFQKQSRRVDGNGVIYMGKKYRWFGNKRRPLPAAAKGGAFVEDSFGRWWVCFHVEVAERLSPANGDAIGIDLGLRTFATLSDGRKIKAPRCYRAWEARLAVAQRSGNKKRVKHIYAKIGNSRKDFLHKLSSLLAGLPFGPC